MPKLGTMPAIWSHGAEKKHEGMQLFCTSSKGAQLLLWPIAKVLYQSKQTGSAFFVILHGCFFFFKLLFSPGKCSF